VSSSAQSHTVTSQSEVSKSGAVQNLLTVETLLTNGFEPLAIINGHQSTRLQNSTQLELYGVTFN